VKRSNIIIISGILCLSIFCIWVSRVVGDNNPVKSDPFSVTNDIYDMDMVMESTVIESKKLGEPLRIDVSYLPEYKKMKCPVVYITDGHWRRIDHKYFHYLAKKGLIPPVIVVGIGYPKEFSAKQIWDTRTVDLIFSPEPFLASLQTEIAPYVEGRYSCDPASRYILGASAGGHFSAYAFLKNALDGKMFFKGYIGSSAYLPETNLIDRYKSLRTRELSENVSLYLAYGGDEDKATFVWPNDQLFEIVDKAEIKGLSFYHYVYPGRDHYTNTRPTLVDGLRMFLGKPGKRSVGLKDLSYDTFSYDFSHSVSVFDWEAHDAFIGVTHVSDKGLSSNGGKGSLRVNADFGKAATGIIETTFDHFENLAEKNIEFNLLVPEELVKAGYRYRFRIVSTYEWRSDESEDGVIKKSGWNRLVYRWKNKTKNGDATLARGFSLVIQKPDSAPEWKGDLYFDNIQW
jgi:predicted alpha/beta superfamily hydrolase